MNISLFDMFSIGIGPSSSHTVGPMLAAYAFIEDLEKQQKLIEVNQIKVELYGSLALTGKGHATDKAILNGLEGQVPATILPERMKQRTEEIIQNQQIKLANQCTIAFDYQQDLLFLQKALLPKHTNGMRFLAYDKNNQLITNEIYYSIGGGFIVTDSEFNITLSVDKTLPYPFHNAKQLLGFCEQHQLTIAELMLANELTWRDSTTIYQGILSIASVMNQCIDNGCKNSGILPGGLEVKRRAPNLYKRLQEDFNNSNKLNHIMHCLNVYAIAVNEENAAGGRVVTAPTNGAAGIIPAVLRCFQVMYSKENQRVYDYFLTAGAIGILYKKGASISGAEVGCQGEVGVASSMAAAGLTAVLGGTVAQIENAAEIAMEHHLGMTCDPVAGLVQIPCIERNAMGAVKAWNAAELALRGDGNHHISLDKVIRTMKQIGADMHTHYKETSLGGLAVNLPEC